MRQRVGTVVVWLVVWAVILAAGVAAENLWLIEENPSSGFAIYRSGRPSAEDMVELCEKGIEQMVVMSGNGAKHEGRYPNDCGLKVVYDHAQDVECALTSDFLNEFDAWVEEAKKNGWKIAFRCNCGCHRTGRLAAYYQMKYRGLTEEAARALMNERGKRMRWPPMERRLRLQVWALEDYIHGRPCRLSGDDARYCVDGSPRGDWWSSSSACTAAQRNIPIRCSDAR